MDSKCSLNLIGLNEGALGKTAQHIFSFSVINFNPNSAAIGRKKPEKYQDFNFEALVFFRFVPSHCQSGKFTAMVTLHPHVHPHYNMNFIYISQF